MMPAFEIQAWLATLPAGAEIGIDEGGLALTTQEGFDGPYIEIGGVRDPGEEPEEEDEPEPDCECVQTDVDFWNNRDCPAHGPRSRLARAMIAQEAEDEAAAARMIPFLLGEDPSKW
jgi:hypothetical protein